MFTSMLAHLNWLHILVATLAYFVLGALWYSKLLFVKPWIKGHGIIVNEDDEEKGFVGIMVGSFILFFLTTTSVAILQQLLPGSRIDAVHAIKYSLLVSCLFSFTLLALAIYIHKSHW